MRKNIRRVISIVMITLAISSTAMAEGDTAGPKTTRDLSLNVPPSSYLNTIIIQ